MSSPIQTILEKVNAVRIKTEEERTIQVLPKQAAPPRQLYQGYPMRAKCQEGAQTDGKISVKLINDAGTVFGSAFDVYTKPSKTTTGDAANAQKHLPKLATDDIVMIQKIDETNWVMIWPTLILKGSSSSTVNSSDLTASDDITGAVLSSIGEW
jgi:hypothetical protein